MSHAETSERTLGVASAAIDFGGTITDVIVRRAGQPDVLLARPHVPGVKPDEVLTLLRGAGVDLPQDGREAPARAALEIVAVTGGRSQELPSKIGGLSVVHVDEVAAAAAGGLVSGDVPTPAIVVSLGTGTGLVLVDPPAAPLRLVGSGIGGGTLLGLARLTLGTTDVAEIGRLARAGDLRACDLTVGDIIGSGIGPVPADATAAHFARLGRSNTDAPRREDIAAALINLVSQAVLRLAVEAALLHRACCIVMIGHALDVPGFRDAIERIPSLDRSFVRLAAEPGFAVARGALAVAEAQARS